jgi:disulfide bond formation protein DsbB
VQRKTGILVLDETTAAAVIALLGLVTVGGFFFFQYGLGYQPCPLCLEQRKAFYVAVPLSALLLLGAGYGASRKVLLLGFAAVALVMLWNTGLSAYHAGVEWKFWQGPIDCSGPIVPLGEGSLLSRLHNVRLQRCDVAEWRLFGISLAGYDVLISLFLAAVATYGFKRTLARPAEP